MSPSQILQQLLVQLGLGVLVPNPPTPPPEWCVYYSMEPGTPDNSIAVYDTTGQSDGRIMPTGEAATHYGFQVRVRSKDYSTGWQKMNAIRNAFEYSVKNTVVGSFKVICIAKMGNVIPLGLDANSRRNLFTLNALVAIVPPV